MSWSKKFEESSKTKHDRNSFDCGEHELNQFIKTQAAKHMQANISRTMVLPSDVPMMNQKYPICSFYSVAPSSICRETLPENLAKNTNQYNVMWAEHCLRNISAITVLSYQNDKTVDKRALLLLCFLFKSSLPFPAIEAMKTS